MRRAFLALNGRRLHLHYGGKGPPVLLLHGSPNDGAMLLPLARQLADEFFVLAPDTPGNGESEALPVAFADAADYAEALIELLDALGLPRVLIYGFHTGAVFAAELAARAPERVQGVVCDGLPAWTDAEAERLGDDYLVCLAPAADASHLVRIWSRVIDQTLYFPWQVRSDATRLDFDLDDTPRLHTRAMEFMACGDTYRMPYQAALHADGLERLARATVPMWLTAVQGDPLVEHLSRFPRRPDITTGISATKEDLYSQSVAWLRLNCGGLVPASGECVRGATMPQTGRFQNSGTGDLLVAGPTNAQQLWLHDVGGSVVDAPAGVLAIGLPGHGYTTGSLPANAGQWLEYLHSIVPELGLDTAAVQVSGSGFGALLADLWHGRCSEFERFETRVPQIEPQWDGSHLLRAWHFSRYRALFKPWHRRPAGARIGAIDPGAKALHERCRALLLAGQPTLDALLPLCRI